MKIGVLLSGASIYDGVEIHEAVLTLLEIENLTYQTLCIATDVSQNHQAAKIARGNILEIKTIVPADIDALVILGGFGSTNNFANWALDASCKQICAAVKLLLVNMYNVGKPIVTLCQGPELLALALGNTHSNQPPNIGSQTETMLAATGKEIYIDVPNRIIAAPCDINKASLGQLQQHIRQAMLALQQLLEA